MNSVNIHKHLSIFALVAVLGGMASLPQTAFAIDDNSTSAINVDSKHLGLKGYDPVAYFKKSAPTLGSAKFQASHEGANYYFESASNRDEFKASPAKFLPQFGGFCAMGVAMEKKLDGDPQAWRIVDGKLYLNVNKDIQKKWLEDVPGNLKKAAQTWPTIKDKTPASL